MESPLMIIPCQEVHQEKIKKRHGVPLSIFWFLTRVSFFFFPLLGLALEDWALNWKKKIEIVYNHFPLFFFGKIPIKIFFGWIQLLFNFLYLYTDITFEMYVVDGFVYQYMNVFPWEFGFTLCVFWLVDNCQKEAYGWCMQWRIRL